MKAITYDHYGDPDVLALTEQPDPKVGPGEVLVRVRSASVNPVDWKVAAGYLDGLMTVRFPVIPGWDVAGVVERVGLDTPEFTPGDEVMAYTRKDWVQAGTFAELVTVPVRALARKPAALDWDQAAGLPLVGLTAYQLLNRLGVQPGDTVLIHAAAGGVGILAVQIARAMGARVIGTASPGNHGACARWVPSPSSTARGWPTVCEPWPPTVWTSSPTSPEASWRPRWRCSRMVVATARSWTGRWPERGASLRGCVPAVPTCRRLPTSRMPAS